MALEIIDVTVEYLLATDFGFEFYRFDFLLTEERQQPLW
jgi:hypothetical protein